ncbi:metallophosphoesterase [Cellulosilyticum ruminicola]|uniref:metallophosphoesterase n=1 Tax=Cellulosilyticum ruminicola TaxID=425254 RepID=UPI0006CFAFF8|nr:metallophosphoesterase [Cellulosilyticum ruminicola]
MIQKKSQMKSWIIYIIIGIIVIMALAGCGTTTEKTVLQQSPLSIIVGTDIHYLSPSMTDHGKIFTEAMAGGDGKFTAYCEEITDAFFEEVREAKPNALILSGDLTFNSDENSHKDMVQKLSALQEAGINVLVLPGNHDIDYPYVYKYEGKNAIRMEGISPKIFKALYKDFGYNQAIAKDKASFSYVYELAEDFWVMCIDSHAKGYEEMILDKTLSWAQKQLQKAQQNNIKVMMVTHENILSHHEEITSGFILKNADKLLALVQKYDVMFNLSGHIHIQHIAKQNNFYEIVTSALSISPNQYGVVEIDQERKMTYEVKVADISAYAKKHGSTDLVLLDFAQMSRMYFNAAGKPKIKKALADLSLSQKETEDMIGFATWVNEAYFAGRIIEEKKRMLKDSRWQLWEKYGQNTFFYTYLKGILKEEPQVESFLYIR